MTVKIARIRTSKSSGPQGAVRRFYKKVARPQFVDIFDVSWSESDNAWLISYEVEKADLSYESALEAGEWS